MDERVRAIAERVASDLVEQGAEAVLLAGSQARGDAHDDSDIDLFAVGEGPRQRLLRVDGHDVGVHWWTALELRERMLEPETALIAVAGLASAEVVADPHGIAAALKRDARSWSWESIDREADAWVRRQLLIWAEYVEKLVRALDDERELDAAALAAQLALRASEILAVHERLRCASENGFWEAVAEAGGPEWAEAQRRAFSVDGEPLVPAARAALELYATLAGRAEALLDENEREVVEQAVRSVRRLAPQRPSG